MLKDDRMMGMLTAVVILVAFGTLLQRVEVFERFFGEKTPVELRADKVTARVNELTTIDVLANDVGLEPGAGERLTIATRPDCGRALVRDGAVQYLPNQGCIGQSNFRYGLGGRSETGEVQVTVAREPDEQEVASAATGEGAASGRPGSETPVEAVPIPSSGAPTAAAADGATAAEPGGSDRTGVTSTEPAPGRDAQAEAGGSATDRPDISRGATQAGAAGPGATPGPAQQGAPGEALGAAPADAGRGGAARPDAPRPAAAETSEPAECTTPPTLTLDAEAEGVTVVMVDSPCDARSVATLSYDGLRFAIPLDPRGTGRLAAPGFRRASEAELGIEGRAPISFEITFRNIDRIDRVAVVWESAADLALNAFEFGARPGGPGHVSPDRSRSFAAVRREGGGWLATYEPAGGVGQHISVYSFWRRYGGPSGVVKLGLVPGAGGEGTCPGGATDGTDFRVLRSVAGKPERPQLGRLAPVDCTVLAGGGPVIGEAVDDLIVRRR